MKYRTAEHKTKGAGADGQDHNGPGLHISPVRRCPNARLTAGYDLSGLGQRDALQLKRNPVFRRIDGNDETDRLDPAAFPGFPLLPCVTASRVLSFNAEQWQLNA